MRIFVASIVLLVSVLAVSTAAQSTAGKKLLGQEPYFVPVEGEAFPGWGFGKMPKEELKSIRSINNPIELLFFSEVSIRGTIDSHGESAVFKIGEIGLVWSSGHQGDFVVIFVTAIPGQQDLEYSLLKEGVNFADVKDPTKYRYIRNNLAQKKVDSMGKMNKVSFRPQDFGPEVKFNQILLLKLGTLYGAIQPLRVKSETIPWSQMPNDIREGIEAQGKAEAAKAGKPWTQYELYGRDILVYRGGYWTNDSSPSSPPTKNLAQAR